MWICHKFQTKLPKPSLSLFLWSLHLWTFALTHLFPVKISQLLFSVTQTKPRKKLQMSLFSKQVLEPTFLFFLLVLFSGFGLMSPVHLNFWNSWFCCLNRVENGGFQSCVWVLLLLSLMLLYSLFCLPLFWWDSRRSLDLTRFSVLGSGFLFLVFICLGFVFLKSKYFWTVAVFYL